VSQGGERARDMKSRAITRKQNACSSLPVVRSRESESALARMAAGPKSSGAASTGVDFLPLFARAALLKITSHFTLIKKTKTRRLERRFLPRALIKADHQSCRDQKHRAALHAPSQRQIYTKYAQKNGGARWSANLGGGCREMQIETR
jgi:hypothetical protein